MPEFSGAISRKNWEKHGEHPSVLDFGAVGDGATDCSASFNAAKTAAGVAGGGEIFVPRGEYILNAKVDVDVSNIRFVGDGPGTIIKRGAGIAAGYGVFDITADDVGFRHFTFDGDVTTPTGKQYGTLTGENGSDDPMHADLVSNTSFWVKPGARRVRFDDVQVQHTGGYSILIDARTDDVEDVEVIGCRFVHNRPHLFGTVGDLNYGSWTGGVHYQSDSRASEGKLYSVRNLLVQGCVFRSNTGNCVWGHLYGFDRLHSNIRVVDNHFENCGLDGVLFGGVIGGICKGNSFRRVGYVVLTDGGTPTPKWLSGAWAVALDTSGVVRGVNYDGNTAISVNGGYIDLDGFGDGAVTGNVLVMPVSGEPEYIEDSIASVTTAAAYGIQSSNSSNTAYGGRNITVAGNLIRNLRNGQIKMFAARNCYVTGNNLDVPDVPTSPPVTLGNIGTGDYQRAYGTVVTENRVSYSPGSELPVIYEDAVSLSAPFEATDKNWVFNNRIFGNGNAFEFQKDANSGSTTGVAFSTAAHAMAVGESTVLQREGQSSDHTAVTRLYKLLSGVSGSYFHVFDEVQITGTSPATYGGPLVNISKPGSPISGGVYATGARATSAVDDAMLTGKLYVDGFLIGADTTYSAGEANRFSDTYGLLRWKADTKQWLKSVSAVAGARVWMDLCSPAGSDTEIQFNQSGAFGASDRLAWDRTNKTLLVYKETGDSANRFIIMRGALSGGTGSFVFRHSRGTLASPAVTQAGDPLGAFAFDGFNGDAGWTATFACMVAAYAAENFSGTGKGSYFAFGTTPIGSITRVERMRIASDGKVLLGQIVDDGSGAIFQATGFLSATVGYYSPNTAANTVNIPNGGVTALSLIAVRNDGVSALTIQRTSATARTYGFLIDSGANLIIYDVTGAATRLTVTPAGALVLAGVAAGQSLLVQAGYVQCDGGFYSAGGNYDTLKAPSGGAYVKWATLDNGLYLKTLGAGTSPNNPSGGYGGLGHRTGATYWYWNGAAWASTDLSAIGGGVTSLAAGGNGLSVNQATGAVTISLSGAVTLSSLTLTSVMYMENNQAIYAKSTGGTQYAMLTRASDNNVYLDNAALNDIYLRPGPGRYVIIGNTGVDAHLIPNTSGASNYLGTSSYPWDRLYVTDLYLGGNLLANSSRGIYVSGVYNTGGDPWINTSGQFVGAGVLCPGYGVGALGFNPWNGSGYDTGRTVASQQFVYDLAYSLISLRLSVTKDGDGKVTDVHLEQSTDGGANWSDANPFTCIWTVSGYVKYLTFRGGALTAYS